MTAVAARPSLGPGGQEVRTSTAESFGHWKHLVAESFVPLAASSTNADHFRGRMRGRRLDRVEVVEVSSTASTRRPATPGPSIRRSSPTGRAPSPFSKDVPVPGTRAALLLLGQ